MISSNSRRIQNSCYPLKQLLNKEQQKALTFLHLVHTLRVSPVDTSLTVLGERELNAI